MLAKILAITNFMRRNEMSLSEFKELTGINDDEADKIFEELPITLLTAKRLISFFGETKVWRYLDFSDFESEFVNSLSEQDCLLYDNEDFIETDDYNDYDYIYYEEFSAYKQIKNQGIKNI